MKTEFNLSEKIIDEGFYIPIIDVKEFIKRLKEELPRFFHDDEKGESWNQHGIINKLAGEKLK